MIKLFRTIRQKLLQSGKLKSYSAYAIGEIFLVVIGILIALQINNWNENRKSENQELLYLSRLVSENKTDVQTFSTFITELEKGMETDVHLSEALKSISISDIELIKSISDYLEFGSIYPIFISSTSTFDDLSSTGNLKLISNSILRDEIVRHYSKHNQLKERILAGNAWALPLDGEFTLRNHVMRFEPSTSFLYPKEENQKLVKEIITARLDYISNAAAHYWINKDCVSQLQKLKDETSQLIIKIEAEIKSKN